MNWRAISSRLFLVRFQFPQVWWRPVLIVGLLLTSTIGLVATPRQLLIGVLALVGGALVVSFLRRPALGLLVAIVAGMVVPWRGPSGLNLSMVLVALLLGLWLLKGVVDGRQFRTEHSQVTWTLLAFVAISFLSFGVGQLPWFTFAEPAPLGAQLGGLSLVVLSAGTFWLGANHLRDQIWLSHLTWWFLGAGAISVALRTALPILGFATRDLMQPMGSVFYVWFIALATSQAAFNGRLRPIWRLALGAMVAATLFMLINLKFADKSTWIPAICAIAAIIGLRSWRAALLLAPALVLIAYLGSSQLVATDEYSISTRFDAWRILIEIIKASPLFGLGFANYYWYTPLFPIRGYAVSFNSHNNYVDIVAQTGLIGLACFLLFFGQVGVLAWRLHGRMHQGFERAFVLGAFGGVIGMVVAGMLGDWILPFFYNVGLNGFRSSMIGWLFLGGLMTIRPRGPTSDERAIRAVA